MAIEYQVVKVEGFDDGAETKAALDAVGATDWDLVQIVMSMDAEEGAVAYCVFKK